MAARVCGGSRTRSTIVVAGCQTARGGVVAATTAEDGWWSTGAAGGGGMVDANHDDCEMLGWWRWRENESREERRFGCVRVVAQSIVRCSWLFRERRSE